MGKVWCEVSGGSRVFSVFDPFHHEANIIGSTTGSAKNMLLDDVIIVRDNLNHPVAIFVADDLEHAKTLPKTRTS